MSEKGHDHPYEEPQHERSPWAARILAIEELLEEVKIPSREEVEAQVKYMEARTYENCARLVARAWVDSAFKDRLLFDTKTAAAELGMDASGTIEFATVENTYEVHNVIVCTLCSCYRGPFSAFHRTGTRALPTALTSSRSRARCCGSSGWNCGG